MTIGEVIGVKLSPSTKVERSAIALHIILEPKKAKDMGRIKMKIKMLLECFHNATMDRA